MNDDRHQRSDSQYSGVFLIRLGIVLLLCLLIMFSGYLLVTDYHTFIKQAAGRYVRPDQLARFRADLLTPDRYFALRWFIPGLGTLLLVVAAIVWKRIPGWVRQLANGGQTLIGSIKNVYRKTSTRERALLGLLIVTVVASRLYFFFQLPLHIDERFTYLYFVSKGPLVSAAYYPNPNNHILFSLLCTITDRFFDQPLLVLRTPALVTGLLALGCSWLVARYYFPAGVALLVTVLLAFTPPVFGYGIQGRGYSLLLCWVMIAAGSVVKIVSAQRAKPVYAWLFGLSSVLGFYTVPVFLYPFAGMSAYLLVFLLCKKDWSRLRYTGVLLFYITAGVLILYLPVFLINGPNAVSGNSWVAPVDWAFFLPAIVPNLAESMYFLWNDLPLSPYVTLVVTGLAMVLAISQRTSSTEKHWLWLYVVCLWVVVPVVFLQRTLLYSRVLVFVLPLQWVAVAVILRRFLPSARYYFTVAALVAVTHTVACLHTFRYLALPTGRGIYNSLDGVANWLYEHRADTVFVQYYEYGLCIRFKYETNHQPIELDIGADRFSSQKKYTFVVVHKQHSFPALLMPSAYRLVYKDAEATIYQRSQADF